MPDYPPSVVFVEHFPVQNRPRRASFISGVTPVAGSTHDQLRSTRGLPR
jgi:hypothetical protein